MNQVKQQNSSKKYRNRSNPNGDDYMSSWFSKIKVQDRYSNFASKQTTLTSYRSFGLDDPSLVYENLTSEFDTPCGKISRYVIYEALREAGENRDREDLYWLLNEPFQEEYLRPFSFQWCCIGGGLDPYKMRELVKEILPKWNNNLTVKLIRHIRGD